MRSNEKMKNNIMLEDLPTEIIQDYLFKYLEDTDIYRLGQTGSQRLLELSESFIQLGMYITVFMGMANLLIAYIEP